MNEPDQNSPKTRPQLLQVLCILTFIGSGLSFASNFMMFFLIDTMREVYEGGNLDGFLSDMNKEAFDILMYTNRTFFFIQAGVYSISLFGAYKMLNLKRIGFHLYTIAQILLIIVSRIYMPQLPFPLFEIMLSLVFISFYARFLRIME